MKPTTEQQNIFDWVKQGSGNAMITAVAGAGKTSTLVESLKHMKGRVFFGAYNKSIAEELQKRTQSTQNVFCKTLHAVGLSAWKKCYPDCTIDHNKIPKLVEKMKVEDDPFVVQKIIGFAKQRGFGIYYDYKDLSKWQKLLEHYDIEEDVDLTKVLEVFIESLNTAEKTIDFEDMIYCPLYFKKPFYKYDWVLIDEAQDINPLRRHMCKILLKNNGRFIAVGDPYQAIYGFTGADANSFELIKKSFQTREFMLSTTFRCPKQVVNLAKRYVPHIRCYEGAENGRLSKMTYCNLLSSKFSNSTGILCRNTKPLLELAGKMMSKGIKCHVIGADICGHLIKLCQKWKRVKDTQSLRNNLNEFLKKQESKINETQFENLQDRIDTVVTLSRKFEMVKDLEKHIKELFSGKEGVALTTVHKSKGLEWDTVYILGRDKLMPSLKATKDWQIQQEKNLIYVAITRAQKVLVDVEIPRKEKLF